MANNPYYSINLRTGGFIIAILDTILSSLLLVLTAFGIGILAACQYGYRCGYRYNDIDIYEWMNYVPRIPLECLNILMAAVLVVCVLTIIMASVLIHGIRTERLSFLKIWMTFKVICLILSLTSFVAIVVMGIFKTPTVAIIIWIDCVLQWYFCSVVYYLFVKIRNFGRVSKVVPDIQKL